jgi:hypothetical protein
MTVLMGEVTDGSMWIPAMREMGWGRMFVTKRPTPMSGEPWGFDNGAYSAWKHNENWDVALYRKRLAVAYEVALPPYLAVLPDLPTCGRESLNFSLYWLHSGALPVEWPWYLAIQDGMDPADVEEHIEGVDGLFLGGSTVFKNSAPEWAELAHRHGKRFHYARSSSGRSCRFAYESGADSCDTANILRSKDNFRVFRNVWGQLMAQRELRL